MSGGRPARVPRTALLALITAGCASLPQDMPGLGGRLSLQVAAHAGAPAHGVNAAFDLHGNAESGTLKLSTPLGPQLAVARWTPAEVLLRTGEGERRFASLAALSVDLLGEKLPLQALPDWLRGRPWPGAVHAPSELGFEQLGWRLDLSRRDQGFVTATREAAPRVSLRVRLDQGP